MIRGRVAHRGTKPEFVLISRRAGHLCIWLSQSGIGSATY